MQPMNGISKQNRDGGTLYKLSRMGFRTPNTRENRHTKFFLEPFLVISVTIHPRPGTLPTGTFLPPSFGSRVHVPLRTSSQLFEGSDSIATEIEWKRRSKRQKIWCCEAKNQVFTIVYGWKRSPIGGQVSLLDVHPTLEVLGSKSQ